MGTAHIKAIDRVRDQRKQYAAQLRELRATWVDGSEQTAEEHLKVQRDLRDQFIARDQRVGA